MNTREARWLGQKFGDIILATIIISLIVLSALAGVYFMLIMPAILCVVALASILVYVIDWLLVRVYSLRDWWTDFAKH